MQKWELLRSLDTFTTQYLETALWAETDGSTPSGGLPLDNNYGIEDFTVASLRLAITECSDFRKLAGEELSQPGFDESTQGHCFWLNRNGHGTGFWDRGEGEVFQKLSDHSKTYGTRNAMVYRGKIHLS